MNIEASIKDRATERLFDEKLVREDDVLITLVKSIGPEPWKAYFLEGKVHPHGLLRGGRILIGLGIEDPLGALAWYVERGKKRVHHLWVDPEARRRGVADLLFSLYKKHVSPKIIAVGPFTPGGMTAAKRAGAKLEYARLIES